MIAAVNKRDPGGHGSNITSPEQAREAGPLQPGDVVAVPGAVGVVYAVHDDVVLVELDFRWLIAVPTRRARLIARPPSEEPALKSRAAGTDVFLRMDHDAHMATGPGGGSRCGPR